MQTEKRAAAIGTFDGVHAGHLSVIDLLKNKAHQSGLRPTAITFSNHPLSLINPEKTPKLLTTLDEKCQLIKREGVEPVILEFNKDLQSMTAKEMLESLNHELGVEMLVLGYDNKFGCDGRNLSREDYQRLGKETGIDVIIASEIKGISSSIIRKAVENGDMAGARKMLHRPFSILGNVVEGNHIGRQLGFPTANLEPPVGSIVPKEGVYAGFVITSNIFKPALINVGKRPTVTSDGRTIIEVHLIDWNGNLYGQEIRVEFLKRLRDEKKFNSLEELKEQLIRDKESIKTASEDNETDIKKQR